MTFESLTHSFTNTLYWASGINNFSAMGKVVNGTYIYNDCDSKKSLTKVKQIGTELLHVGTKWASGFMAASYIPYVGNVTDQIYTFSQQLLKDTTSTTTSWAVSKVFDFAIPLTGIAALGYAGKTSLTQLKKLGNDLQDAKFVDTPKILKKTLKVAGPALVGVALYESGPITASAMALGLLAVNRSKDIKKIALPLAGAATTLYATSYTGIYNPSLLYEKSFEYAMPVAGLAALAYGGYHALKNLVEAGEKIRDIDNFSDFKSIGVNLGKAALAASIGLSWYYSGNKVAAIAAISHLIFSSQKL